MVGVLELVTEVVVDPDDVEDVGVVEAVPDVDAVPDAEVVPEAVLDAEPVVLTAAEVVAPVLVDTLPLPLEIL